MLDLVLPYVKEKININLRDDIGIVYPIGWGVVRAVERTQNETSFTITIVLDKDDNQLIPYIYGQENET